jgi:hypothetical protein
MYYPGICQELLRKINKTSQHDPEIPRFKPKISGIKLKGYTHRPTCWMRNVVESNQTWEEHNAFISRKEYILKMEAACSSETLLTIYQSTRCHIPKDIGEPHRHLRASCLENVGASTSHNHMGLRSCYRDSFTFCRLSNPSSRSMALGLTEPLTEMSTRNLPGAKGRPALRADNLTAICERIF